MNRPYVFCHMLTSLDGKIMGSYMETPEGEQAGAVFSGLSPDGRLVEAMELPGYDFYIGVQYHPEFKSRPNQAHPLFKAFIEAALRRRKER